MAKIFLCDKCGGQFGGPLDEVKIPDENGITQTYDLCAPCRADLNTAKSLTQVSFFNDIKSVGLKGVKIG